MNKTASVTFTTQKQDVPHGVVVHGFRVELKLAGVVLATQITTDPAAKLDFPITAPGVDYVVEVTRVAESGDAISPVVSSAPFTVAPDQIDVPLSVTVTLSDVVAVPAAVAVVVTP